MAIYRKRMVNWWKVTAIIFIILFVLETAGFVSLLYIGMSETNKENVCRTNICQNKGYTSFAYDSYESLCYCYLNDEVAYTEYLK